ncbi:MAG: hypothetical protein P9L93_01705 [Candidatus Gorgyraea atricola]|nr:hypothetical protein [Candidatus Gorgyraea atricola]
MESSRPYTFRIILLIALFACGFALGKGVIARKDHDEASKKKLSSIPRQRFQAIEKALKEGKTEYEFEVGYTPALNK